MSERDLLWLAIGVCLWSVFMLALVEYGPRVSEAIRRRATAARGSDARPMDREQLEQRRRAKLESLIGDSEVVSRSHVAGRRISSSVERDWQVRR